MPGERSAWIYDSVDVSFMVWRGFQNDLAFEHVYGYSK